MSSFTNFKKLSVTSLTGDFRKATAVVSATLPATTPADHVYVETTYAGINASDLNFTKGAYLKGVAPPFDCGFEGLGKVVQVGAGVAHIKVGSFVAFSHTGSFAEFLSVPAAACVPVPDDRPEMLVLPVSALTAAVAIGEEGRPKRGEVALVTAAAGGTGQMAVQLLKHHYGCKVIGTCSSADKVAFLKSIGCDEVINYKTESLDEKLTEYAPQGLDVVYECVGGDTFNTAVQHIALHGRIIVIGSISSYQDGSTAVAFKEPGGRPLPMFLLVRSASIHGFFLPHYRSVCPTYMKTLLEETASGRITLHIDKAKFVGVEAIADAVDHLYSGTRIVS